MRIVSTHDEAALARLRVPRADLVVERAEGDDRFSSATGPFSQYERRLTVDGDTVTETTDFRLAVPFWWLLFALPYRWSLRRRHDRAPWWAPPSPPDARAATALGLLCSLALVDGYVGTLLTQTLTYAANDFGVGRADQGTTLAVVRVGALVAVGAGALADRGGRRRPILLSALGACLFAVAGAFAPNLAVLTITQLFAAGCAGALGILIVIVAAEEVPAGSRAYALSLITMAGALGAGMCVWVLPLADTGRGGWRAVYAIAILGVPLITVVARRLPESRRFERPHPSVAVRDHRRRLWLLALAGFLIALFVAPAFQFQNDFLRRERGFSAARITLFTLLTSTPASIGIVAGGRLADVRGRRVIGAIGIIGGTLATVAMYSVFGWPLWFWSAFGSVIGGLTIPALAVYRPELFPTGLRGRAAGIVEVVALAGSAIGVLVAGRLADRWGSFIGPIALLSIGPLLVAALVLLRFPETAGVSLEVLNPGDEPGG